MDCPICSKIRAVPQSKNTLIRALPTYHARAVTHADVLQLGLDEFGNKYAFVFINAFTKYTIIVPSKDKTPVSMALAMLQYASVVGMTEVIWSDNGPEYVHEVVTNLAQCGDNKSYRKLLLCA